MLWPDFLAAFLFVAGGSWNPGFPTNRLLPSGSIPGRPFFGSKSVPFRSPAAHPRLLVAGGVEPLRDAAAVLATEPGHDALALQLIDLLDLAAVLEGHALDEGGVLRMEERTCMCSVRFGPEHHRRSEEFRRDRQVGGLVWDPDKKARSTHLPENPPSKGFKPRGVLLRSPKWFASFLVQGGSAQRES